MTSLLYRCCSVGTNDPSLAADQFAFNDILSIQPVVLKAGTVHVVCGDVEGVKLYAFDCER